MNEREFNLLDEPWIIVLNFDGSTEKVSLIDALARAAEFSGLAGELPTQDAAILRLLLAVLHRVIAGYGPNDDGSERDAIQAPLQALEYWKELWNRRKFPMESIKRHLEEFHDRFYLFDPEYPFFQVPEINGKKTAFTAEKLNGEICESGHKPRLFTQRNGSSKTELEYDEAARWLIHINSYSDSAFKDKDNGEKSIGVGWLGKIGLIMAEGDSLFETLMLNLILLKDGKDEIWDYEMPIWECEKVRTGKNIQVSMPRSLSELYTFQSRRIVLLRKDGKVIGCEIAGGEAFEIENAFVEQMTIWKKEDAPNQRAIYRPRIHDTSKQMWRSFATMFSIHNDEKQVNPGVVEWIARLAGKGILPDRIIGFRVSAVQYDSKKCSITECYTDNMKFNEALLSEKGSDWIPAVIEQVEISNALVIQLANLAQSIAKAAGNSDGAFIRDAAKEQAYFALDMPFRSWLAGIDPAQEKTTEAEERWWNIAQPIVRRLGAELIAQAGPQALVGREVDQKNITAPDAYNYFLYRTKNKQTLKNGGKKSGK